MSDGVTIYALTDPDSGKVRYVGSTIHFARRIKQHLYRSTHGHPCYSGKRVTQWVMELLDAGRTPGVIILESDPPDGLDRAEQRWITHCLNSGAPLLNTLRRRRQLVLPWSITKPKPKQPPEKT